MDYGAAWNLIGYDEFFIEAGIFIIEKKRAAIGMLQRRFKIGFNRAARIMNQLVEAGVVGPENGTQPRKLLMTLDEFEKYVEHYSISEKIIKQINKEASDKTPEEYCGCRKQGCIHNTDMPSSLLRQVPDTLPRKAYDLRSGNPPPGGSVVFRSPAGGRSRNTRVC